MRLKLLPEVVSSNGFVNALKKLWLAFLFDLSLSRYYLDTEGTWTESLLVFLDISVSDRTMSSWHSCRTTSRNNRQPCCNIATTKTEKVIGQQNPNLWFCFSLVHIVKRDPWFQAGLCNSRLTFLTAWAAVALTNAHSQSVCFTAETTSVCIVSSN